MSYWYRCLPVIPGENQNHSLPVTGRGVLNMSLVLARRVMPMELELSCSDIPFGERLSVALRRTVVREGSYTAERSVFLEGDHTHRAPGQGLGRGSHSCVAWICICCTLTRTHKHFYDMQGGKKMTSVNVRRHWGNWVFFPALRYLTRIYRWTKIDQLDITKTRSDHSLL